MIPVHPEGLRERTRYGVQYWYRVGVWVTYNAPGVLRRTWYRQHCTYTRHISAQNQDRARLDNKTRT